MTPDAEVGGELAPGARPTPLVEVRPQGVQRSPFVQILDVPVPPVVLGGVQDRILQQIEEQAFADDMEQEIAVPKPSPTSSSCCSSFTTDSGTLTQAKQKEVLLDTWVRDADGCMWAQVSGPRRVC